MTLKIYKIKFDPMWPVPCGLVVLAHSKKSALKIAIKTIKHSQTKPMVLDSVTNIKIDKPKVVFYKSGDY